MSAQPTEPLAIIGIGCLFPGAGDFPAYWGRIVERHDAIRPVPATHWRAEDYLDADPKAPDRVYATRGGFLDPVSFNPVAFGIPPSNLEATDASQLLGLVVAQMALEDCGYAIRSGAATSSGKSVDRSRVSVILGVTGTLQLVIPLGARLGHPLWRRALKEAGVEEQVANDVIERIADGYVPWQENSFPGLLGNVVAGRIANRFDLGGTNCVVDAACASSLSAIHLAAMELATHKADVVLTGGVDAFNDIFMFTCFSKTPALSPTGNARPFDAAGDGTVLGEGLGMVVLKRLADARRDGDRIYAVLRGIGSSSDGKGGAIYAPRKEGQIDALRSAYATAGVSPETIELVEAHGTGTRVGDATEISALAEVYGGQGKPGPWCAIGSVKSQIGHTKAAAGVAGLIKAAAALYHKVLPPTIKVQEPLETLRTPGCPLYVNTSPRPWLPSPDHPRRAAVSAFGFGGSNFHAVLEEADPARPEADWPMPAQILAFSGADEAAVLGQLRAVPTNLSWLELRQRADLTRQAFRVSAPCRLLIVTEPDRNDLADAIALLEKRFESVPGRGIFVGKGSARGSVGVVFSGQGSQYVGMLRDLVVRFPVAFNAFTRASAAFDETNGRRLVDLVYPPTSFQEAERQSQEEQLRATDVAQPALGAIELAGWEVLRSLGLKPAVLAGHSFGELIALCAAGRLSPETAARLARRRGEHMAHAASGSKGAMLAVRADEPTIRRVLSAEGLDLTLANKNTPQQIVLSGPRAQIQQAATALGREKISSLELAVSAAFHSPLVAEARTAFASDLAGVALTPGLPVLANSTAGVYPDDPDQARELLAGQLARPVEWVRSIEAMYELGVRTFVEIGPGARLAGLIEVILKGRDAVVVALDASAGKNHGLTDLARCLAGLAATGHAIDLASWDRCQPARPASKAMSVDLTGANYVRPRTPRPSVSPVPPVSRTATPVVSQPATNGTHVLPPPVISLEAKGPAPAMTVSDQPVPPPASINAPALGQALEVTRESLTALQKMQEQTAVLHRQYLEGQDHAQRTVHLLVEQQQRLLLAALGQGSLPASTGLAPVRVEKVAPVRTTLPTPPASPPPSPPRVEPRVVVPEPIPAPAPVPVPPPALQPQQPLPVAPASTRTQGVLIEVIAEKTGYPAEMLQPEMTLDADLGIDSIKRVEILSALQERLPDAPIVKPEHLGTLHTLADIVSFLDQNGPKSAPASKKDSPVSTRTQGVLIEVIAEKTGYPAEMLQPEMTLDADLGIDSIKRVEILSALQERLPDAPIVKPEHLGTLHTLADIVAFLDASPVQKPVQKPAQAAPPAPVPAAEPAAKVERSITWPAPLPAGERKAVTLATGDVWILGDGSLADATAELLARQGYQVVPAGQGTPVALLILSNEPSDEFLRTALLMAKSAGPSLRTAHGALLTVARLDGAFGFSAAPPRREPLDGGLAGLAKTAGHEWPEVRCRALDIAPDLDVERVAESIVEELFLSGPVEVGISGQGKVTLTRMVRPPAELTSTPFHRGDVVVVSGGARGVTAEVAVALARQFRPTLVLLGRSPETTEPAELASAVDEAALKGEIARRNPGLPPRVVGEQARAVLAGREVRHTLERIRAAGATVVYRVADVRDAEAVRQVLGEVRRQHGPIRGIIHGAGVLADALILDKTAEQFDRVYSTKVAGLRSLLSACGDDDLRALVLFSSSTARFGRSGQVDYAIANEVLNKLAWQEDVRRPHCRVVSFNWGPWAGGMVTPGLRQLFASEGVGVIPLEAGARLVVEELRSGEPAPREIVVLASGSQAPASPLPDTSGPNLAPALPLAFERVLDLNDYPVLASHKIAGRPVVPAALLLEWLAHAGMVLNPGLTFHGVDGLRILHGVTFDEGAPRVRIGAGKAVRRDGQFVAPAELRSIRADGREVLNARADIVLVNTLPAAPAPEPLVALDPFTQSPAEVYRRKLFHGPMLQGIESYEGCGEAGIVATVAPAPATTEWVKHPLRQLWLADPLVLDCSFQLMVLWTQERRGAASLPCHLGRYRQYRKAFPGTSVRTVVSIERTGELSALADIDYVDSEGRLIARLEGYECILDPNLLRTFGNAVNV